MFGKRDALHVLIVTGGSIGIVGGNVQLVADLDGNIRIANGVTSTNLRALGVKSDGQGTASLNASSLTSVIDDRLVVLIAQSIALSSWWGY